MTQRDTKHNHDGSARRRRRGFETAAVLVAQKIRVAGESRGFAVARLLTNWAEVVGPDLAARTRPVRVSHGRGFGATLVLLVEGVHAPLVEMQLPRIRDCVNACYGFNAVSKIILTQTAATGFAEGQAQFTHARGATRQARPGSEQAGPEQISRADDVARGFSDPRLAAAIRQLALNTLSRRDANDRKATK